jgi:hypothetical protein
MQQAARRRVAILSVFGVVLMILAGAAWCIDFYREIRPAVKLALSIARRSSEVQRAIGAPLQRSRFTTGRLVSKAGSGTADLTIHISGSLGEGSLLEWAQEDRGQWQVCSLLFRAKNITGDVTLVSDTSTHCDRE